MAYSESVPTKRLKLVTGGEGFIGKRIVRLTGATSYDLKSDENILDTESLLRASEGVVGIFHCAGKINVPESFDRPADYYRTNVEGTQSVIQVAKLRKAKVIFSSSAAVYGESNKPVTELSTLEPHSPYAENKQEGERLLQTTTASSVILRYFNVYGPGQSSAYAGVITAFILAALQNEDIVIHGDGEQTRDFVYVDDVARANVIAFESECQNGEIFNIATGTATSVNTLAQEIIRLTNSSSRILYAPARRGDIVYSRANVSKAEELLGWKADIDLEQGLRKTIESFKGI